MAVPRMRWTHDGPDLIGARARDGAELRGIDEPREPRRPVEHVHVYLNDVPQVAKPAVRRHGSPPPTRDQETASGGSKGAVICRLGKHGTV
jgi:hypothetical protein